MTPVQVTWLRELRQYRGMTSCGIPVCAFLAACGWSFVSLLWKNEGSVLQLQTIWGLSLVPWLPILSALLTMRLFSEERATGMLDLLLSSPIRERDLVFGKYYSAMTVLTFSILATLLLPFLVLPRFAPSVQPTVRVLPFLATFVILLLQGATWCAAGTMISVFFRNQASSAVCSLLLCSAAPFALYLAILSWIPAWRAKTAYFPMLVHVYDFSTGLFSAAVIAFYLLATLFFLFGCSKLLSVLRLR